MSGSIESAASACRCGASPHADDPGRCAAGHPLRGHGAELSLRHGLHAATRTAEDAEIEALGRRLFEQSVADAGGRDELIARALADHEYRALLHVRILKLALALEVHGEFDKRGRLRKGWIELLDRLIFSATTIDKTLGLARRAKRVPTLDDYLDGQAANGARG